MENSLKDKLLQMDEERLNEIIENSELYAPDVVEKAKELLTNKKTATAPVIENTVAIKPSPSRKKGLMIVSISVIVVLVALLATVFGIRANNADKYVLVEENCDGSLSTYEYEFDFLNRVTKRYTYTDGELFGTSYYNSEGKYKEVIGFEDSDCTTYTLKSQTDDVIEWSFDDGNGTGIMTEKYNSHGDVIEAIQPLTDGDIVYKYNYQYDNNGNKSEGVMEVFCNNQKVQNDLETIYTYITIKEYKSKTADKTVEKETEKKATSKTSKELRILTTADFEPFEYYDNTDLVGFDIDLMKALCENLEYSPVFEDVEYGEIINEVGAEEADCGIAGISVTEERARIVDFTDTYISCYVSYDGEEKSEASFAIAFPKGSSLIAEFNSAIEEAKTDGTIDALAEKYDLDVLNEDKSENNKPVNNMIETAKKGLGVPNNKSITYETSEPFSYVGTNCVEITFYENGELVANGKVNAETGEVLAAIIEYDFDHSLVPESSNGNTSPSTNEYKKPEVAYYYTINAKAIPKADGSYTFYHICPYCHEETPALSAVKNRKVKCRFSGCTGRTAGYTYTIEAIYN